MTTTKHSRAQEEQAVHVSWENSNVCRDMQRHVCLLMKWEQCTEHMRENLKLKYQYPHQYGINMTDISIGPPITKFW